MKLHPGDGREHLQAAEVIAAGAGPLSVTTMSVRMGRVTRSGLRAGEIPLLPRVLQVVDVYDALRTARPLQTCDRPRSVGADDAEKVRQGLLDGDSGDEFFGMLLEQRRVA